MLHGTYKPNDEIIIESEASQQQHRNHNLHIREVKAVVCTKVELYALSATEDVHIELLFSIFDGSYGTHSAT